MQLCNFCFLPAEMGVPLLKTAECHGFSDDYREVEDVAHSPACPSYLMISGFISPPCQYEETQEAFETVWTEKISAGLCFHNGEPTLSHTLAKYFFYVCFASVWPLGGLARSLHACRLQSLRKECGVKGNKGVYLIKDEKHCPIYTQWRYEAVCLLLLQTILVFANNRGLLRRMPSGCMCLLRAKLQVGVKHLCVCSSLLHKTKQNNSTDKQHRERENLWHAWSHSDTSVSGTSGVFKNKCAGRVPGGALVATHPFSPVPVPVAVPVAVLVCHICQPLPAPYSFSSLLLSEPVCPLSDGTRCPWCYYPRTLPGRARGRFPPIIVISNGQPGERERRRSNWASLPVFSLHSLLLPLTKSRESQQVVF